MPVTIKKLGEQIGAVFSGEDISSPIDEETLSLLRRAFYSHSVLVFRDQEISNEQHIAFSGGFGPLEMTIPNDPVGDGGPIGVICNVDESGDIIPPDDKRMLYQKGNTMWHSDGAFRRVPLRGSLLSAKEVPPEGGETEYASLRAAYTTLPAARQSLIEDLVAEHSLAYSRSQIAADLMEDEFLKNTPPTPHPLVRMIPETGKKCCSSAPTPPTSSAGLSKRAGFCCASCSSGRHSRSSSTATNGNCTISSCGTTSAACIAGAPGTAGTTAASCIAPRYLATLWYLGNAHAFARPLPYLSFGRPFCR